MNLAMTLPGESILKNAPRITVDNQACIPQQYFQFQHQLQTVEQILTGISFDNNYMLFVTEENNQLILQVGIIGPDNYEDNTANKIVYGRKWRIERDLPTSEIIQTAFLAIKTAREHEIRERFTLIHNDKKTTPFNNHQDLPLMARLTIALHQRDSPQSLPMNQWLDNIHYDKAALKLTERIELPTGQTFYQVRLAASTKTRLPELQNGNIGFLTQEPSYNAFLFGLMGAFIAMSDRHVDETFTFNGYARFSQGNQVTTMAELSSKTRAHDKQNSTFQNRVIKNNESVDAARAPQLKASGYSLQQLRQLNSHTALQGFKPILVA